VCDLETSRMGAPYIYIYIYIYIYDISRLRVKGRVKHKQYTVPQKWFHQLLILEFKEVNNKFKSLRGNTVSNYIILRTKTKPVMPLLCPYIFSNKQALWLRYHSTNSKPNTCVCLVSWIFFFWGGGGGRGLYIKFFLQ